MKTDTSIANHVEILSDDKGRNAYFPLFGNFSEQHRPQRLLLCIHGKERNAASLFRMMRQRLTLTNHTPRPTLLVCPHFLIEEDMQRFHLDDHWAIWHPHWKGWKYGYKSIDFAGTGQRARISSFAVLDMLIERYLEQWPSLCEVVIMGHSSGGQMVHRYAASSTVPERVPKVHFHFVVINAGTFLYFSPERPHPQLPGQWFIPHNCPGYDRYKYGLADYHNCGYIKKVGRARILSQYPQREVVIIAGARDNDPAGPGIDNDNCRERLQGRTRLERAKNFFAHTLRLFGHQVLERHSLRVVPDCGHNIRHFVRAGALDPWL